MMYFGNSHKGSHLRALFFFYLDRKKWLSYSASANMHHSFIIPYEIVPPALKSQVSHMLLLGDSISSPSMLRFVGGIWWISERCSFHLLTAEIAWGCWRVPDKQGLLHASPWSTFSFAPWIHHGLWQHGPFWAFYIIVDVVAAAGSCWWRWWRWLWCSGGLKNG